MCCCSKGKGIFAIIVILFLVVAGGYVINEKYEFVTETKPADDVVIVTIGDENIYLSDVMDFYKSNPQLKNVPLEMVYKDILNNMIDFKAITVAAKKAKLEKSPEYIKGMKEAKDQILRAVFIKTELDKKATDEAIKKLYDEYVAANPPEEEIEASHILVSTEAKAKEVIRKLNKGQDFAKLAAEYSSDSNGKNGGQLGYFKKSAMVPEFANAAFAMDVGSYSKKPIKTMFGWHVIKVTDRRMSEPVPLDQIKDMLKMRISEQAFPEVIAKAKKEARVEIKPTAYKNQYIDLTGGKGVEPEEVIIEEEVVVEGEPTEDADSATSADDADTKGKAAK